MIADCGCDVPVPSKCKTCAAAGITVNVGLAIQLDTLYAKCAKIETSIKSTAKVYKHAEADLKIKLEAQLVSLIAQIDLHTQAVKKIKHSAKSCSKKETKAMAHKIGLVCYLPCLR